MSRGEAARPFAAKTYFPKLREWTRSEQRTKIGGATKSSRRPSVWTRPAPKVERMGSPSPLL